MLPALDDAALAPFIVGALSTHPDLDDIVVDHLVDRLASTTSPTTWALAMHTLHTVDFTRTVQAWAEIAQRHVVPALYQVLLSFVIAGIEPLRGTRPEIVAAMAEIAALPPRTSSLRDRVLAGLDDQTVTAAITATTCKDDAVHCSLPLSTPARPAGTASPSCCGRIRRSPRSCTACRSTTSQNSSPQPRPHPRRSPLPSRTRPEDTIG
jgi:hypothetical protein